MHFAPSTCLSPILCQSPLQAHYDCTHRFPPLLPCPQPAPVLQRPLAFARCAPIRTRASLPRHAPAFPLNLRQEPACSTPPQTPQAAGSVVASCQLEGRTSGPRSGTDGRGAGGTIVGSTFPVFLLRLGSRWEVLPVWSATDSKSQKLGMMEVVGLSGLELVSVVSRPI